MLNRFAVGDRVIKNPATWYGGAFDAWGAGVGVGVVLESKYPGEVDVRWPTGRCHQHEVELLPAPASTAPAVPVQDGGQP